MSDFRVERNGRYSVTSNYHVKDKNLSLQAKGLLTMMLVSPNDLDCTIRGLAAVCKEGERAIKTTMVELEEHGYIERRRVRGENGLLGKTECVVYETPRVDSPRVDSPRVDSPRVDSPRVDSPRVDSPRVENALLDSNAQSVKTNNLECRAARAQCTNPLSEKPLESGENDENGVAPEVFKGGREEKEKKSPPYPLKEENKEEVSLCYVKIEDSSIDLDTARVKSTTNRKIEDKSIDLDNIIYNNIYNNIIYNPTKKNAEAPPEPSEPVTTPTKKPAKVFPHDHDAYMGAALLGKWVGRNYPNLKPASEDDIQRWADDIDKIHRIDKRDWDEISDVLIFSQKDTFWRQNIRSGATLRKQYDKILIKMTERERRNE